MTWTSRASPEWTATLSEWATSTMSSSTSQATVVANYYSSEISFGTLNPTNYLSACAKSAMVAFEGMNAGFNIFMNSSAPAPSYSCIIFSLYNGNTADFVGGDASDISCSWVYASEGGAW